VSVPAPQVIILTNYNDLHLKDVKFSPRTLYQRDNYTCQYCNKKMRAEKLSIDHVIPKSRSGKKTWSNCVTSCKKCNSKKADRTPREAGFTLNNRPAKPKWNPVIHVKKENRPTSWEPLLKKHW
jgi:5-methylcytosine-specific restriction endonuclease McrA